MNNKKNLKTHKYQSQLARKLLFQYFLSLFLFACIYVAFLFFSIYVCGTITWQPYDPLYQLLHWCKDYIVLISGLIGLTGWAAITYRIIAKPLRYLDKLVAASGQLAQPSPDAIVLPADLKSVQDELNQVREQALRSALLAKEAEQRKNDMIVYLAHDLKTPLTSVLGYLQLLQDEPQLSPEIRAKYTGIALSKAKRLEELINEFFDITRFNLTTLSLEPERLNISRMLEQITCEFLPIMAEKDLFWDIHIMPDIEIFADPDKLARVFDNLICNAVNYSYRSSAIHLSLSMQNQQVCLCIRNHGKTIAPEKLSRIFEQFFRLDFSRSSATGGTGLGLAISKEIVKLHGGTIAAESANESITFTVLLPVG